MEFELIRCMNFQSLKLSFKLLFLALITIAGTCESQAALNPVCREIFNPLRALVRHRESVSGRLNQQLNERELDLFLQLKDAINLSVEALYERFDRLNSYTSADIAMVAAPVNLINLAATSLKNGISLENTKITINSMLLKVGRNLPAPSGNRGQLKIPHRVLLVLAEASLRLNRDPEEVASLYNNTLLELRERGTDPASLLTLPLPDLALETTLGELIQNQ
jgi:hypothetical protein